MTPSFWTQRAKPHQLHLLKSLNTLKTPAYQETPCHFNKRQTDQKPHKPLAPHSLWKEAVILSILTEQITFLYSNPRGTPTVYISWFFKVVSSFQISSFHCFRACHLRSRWNVAELREAEKHEPQNSKMIEKYFQSHNPDAETIPEWTGPLLKKRDLFPREVYNVCTVKWWEFMAAPKEFENDKQEAKRNKTQVYARMHPETWCRKNTL